MAGYTPLFSSLTTGTLCGRWPDIGLWPIVLSLSDRHGVVDVTHAYLAGVTGLPVDDVIACMRRFCEPDPGSRSPSESGARLVLLESHRDWGWKIVNHGSYRERARKHSYDAARVEDGRNAERMATRRDPTRPAKTPAHPPSDSDSDSNTDKSKRARAKRASRVPLDFQPDLELARSQIPDLDVEREVQKFRDWEFSTAVRQASTQNDRRVRAVGYQPSTPSYADLTRMRKRGQRPIGPLYVSDDRAFRDRMYTCHGLYGVPLPKPEQCFLLAGLWVVMLAKRDDRTQEIAELIASANPKRFSVDWLGERTDLVVGLPIAEWVAA
jgi:hypothetical protein